MYFASHQQEVDFLYLYVAKTNQFVSNRSFVSALAKFENVTGQTQILWSDPKNRGWKQKVPYKFSIQHRPKSGRIRLEMYEASTKLFDTGDIFDNGLAGGKVGVFTFSQEKAIWSQLKYICREE